MSTDPSEFVHPTDEPSPQEIEAAAKALHQFRMSRPSELAWLSLDVFSRDLWAREATVALTAAAKVRSA